MSSFCSEDSRWPTMNICCCLSCLATSRAEEPETSIQVLLNRAHAESMKVR